MIQITLLEQAVDPSDTVLRAFIRHAGPGLIHDYTLITAKGGRFADEQKAAGFEIEHYDRDQSMLTHLFNGIFPTMRLLSILGQRNIRQLSNIEKEVYLVAYCMHDLDKVLKQQGASNPTVLQPKGGLDTHNRVAIDAVGREAVRQIESLGLAKFFPNYLTYLDDILFLAINTQKRSGTHLNSYLFHFGLKERQLSILRQLCAYSDVIAYFVQSPADIIHGRGASALREAMAFISQDTLRFAYHKMRDVRGLLTNVLNNSVTHLLRDQGLIPYLFFPDGVVYLMDTTNSIQVTEEIVTYAAKEELTKVCKRKILHSKPGFKFDPKGLVKKPEYYHDFLSVGDYIRLIADQAISMTTRDISANPAAKLLEMQTDGLTPKEIDVAFKPDLRIGMLARFLINLWKEVFDRIADKEVRERLAEQVLNRLELTELGLTQRVDGKAGMGVR